MGGSDAWGSDEEDRAEELTASRYIPRSLGTPPKNGSSGSWNRAGEPSADAPTLVAWSLATLARHVDQLLEMGPDVLECLPADCKSKLLAVALHKNILTDRLVELVTGCTSPGRYHWSPVTA
jgi:hypothetical protein